jgi:hypothetical protein
MKEQKSGLLSDWRQAPNIRSVHGVQIHINFNHEDVTYSVCRNVVKLQHSKLLIPESRSHALNSGREKLNTLIQGISRL